MANLLPAKNLEAGGGTDVCEGEVNRLKKPTLIKGCSSFQPSPDFL